jgi:hypothetical protein
MGLFARIASFFFGPRLSAAEERAISAARQIMGSQYQSYRDLALVYGLWCVFGDIGDLRYLATKAEVELMFCGFHRSEENGRWVRYYPEWNRSVGL